MGTSFVFFLHLRDGCPTVDFLTQIDSFTRTQHTGISYAREVMLSY
jgi:hypothetical protein